MKPTNVFVHWSESPAFGEGETVPFREFEIRAAKVAADRGAGGGYLKTKITVNFDEGSTYGCRLDLAQDDDRGFQHHMRKMLVWAETKRGQEELAKGFLIDQALLDAARSMDFSPDKPAPATKRHPVYAAALANWAKNPTGSAYVGSTDTARLIRAALKARFPRTKFSVRTDKSSLSAAINIHWVDGPTEALVDALVQPFAGAGFDGMTDYKYTIGSWLLPDGTAATRSVKAHYGTDGETIEAQADGALPVHFGADFVFTRRTNSPEAMRRALVSYAKRYPGDDLAEAIKAGEIGVVASDYDGGAQLTGDPQRFTGIGAGSQWGGDVVLRQWAARRMVAA